MRTIALRLAYDGTHFIGSQWQSNGRSVQGEVERAWEAFTQQQQRFTFAGRTDAGVHAQGQVAHVRTDVQHTVAVIQRAMHALVPNDIAVLEAWEPGQSFHARFSAIWRWYRYLIDNGNTQLPLLRHCTLHYAHPLDSEAMQAALLSLSGSHDFAAFTKMQQPSHSTVRCCSQATCRLIDIFARPIIAIDLTANAFLQHMVRTIVGTLLLVGHGHMTPEEFGQLIEKRDRRQAGPTAAAHGLTLMAVGYPED